MHNRRARPALQEDLNTGWESPQPQRWLSEGNHAELHPLSELPHPIVAKAVASFGANPADDNYVGPIASSTRLPLLEIKNSQWRGGVWADPEFGVRWLLVAGLAKGGHQDRDDFYRRVRRENDSGDLTQWLPTDADLRLLKQETAARLRTEWELEVQRAIRDAICEVHSGGTRRIEISHPIFTQGSLALVDLSITVVRDNGYEADEIDLEILPSRRYAGSDLLWQLIVRVLISIHPPEQSWDRYKDTYSNIGEPDAWTKRVVELDRLVDANELAVSEPGSTSHYTHSKHLAGSTVGGSAVRALCGAHFVPTQDHEALPRCPICQQRLAELPK